MGQEGGGGIVYDEKGKGKRDGNIRINGVIEGGKRKNVGEKCGDANTQAKMGLFNWWEPVENGAL